MYPHENGYDPKAIKRKVLERSRKILSNFSYFRFNIEHALYYRYLICRERENRVFTCKDSLSFDPRKEYNIEIEDPFVKGKWIFSRFNFSFMSYIYLCILSMVIHSIVHFRKRKRMILQNLRLLRLQFYICKSKFSVNSNS